MHFLFWLVVLLHPNYHDYINHDLNTNIESPITPQDRLDGHHLQDLLANELDTPETDQTNWYIINGITDEIGGM